MKFFLPENVEGRRGPVSKARNVFDHTRFLWPASVGVRREKNVEIFSAKKCRGAADVEVEIFIGAV